MATLPSKGDAWTMTFQRGDAAPLNVQVLVGQDVPAAEFDRVFAVMVEALRDGSGLAKRRQMSRMAVDITRSEA